jgi:hypothetical protein
MNSRFKISAALAAATLAAAAMGYATSANASSSLRSTCVGTNIHAVVRCCDTWVRRNGKPNWMLQSGQNCRSAATCISGNTTYGVSMIAFVSKPKCYIDDTPPLNGSHDTPTKGRSLN